MFLNSLSSRYAAVRQHTLKLAAPLSAEDQCVQSMPDTSPTKWHLAHTSWFFENVVLLPYLPGYQVFDDAFAYLAPPAPATRLVDPPGAFASAGLSRARERRHAATAFE